MMTLIYELSLFGLVFTLLSSVMMRTYKNWIGDYKTIQYINSKESEIWFAIFTVYFTSIVGFTIAIG